MYMYNISISTLGRWWHSVRGSVRQSPRRTEAPAVLTARVKAPLVDSRYLEKVIRKVILLQLLFCRRRSRHSTMIWTKWRNSWNPSTSVISKEQSKRAMTRFERTSQNFGKLQRKRYVDVYAYFQNIDIFHIFQYRIIFAFRECAF